MKPAKGSGVYNLIVIGAGTAGLVSAAGTASLGGRVALIERHKMGGDCLNFGCVPSKALISSARLAQRIREAERWGFIGQKPRFDFGEVIARMQARRALLAPNDSQERFEKLGVDVFRGEAKFLSPNELEVDGQKLRARRFVIATGTWATVPPIEGLERVPFFTNETIFDELQSAPESMVILGGGPIGCELGQTFNRLGVQVTILDVGERILRKEDPEVSRFAKEKLESEGVVISNSVEVKSCAAKDGGVEVKFQGRAEGAPLQSVRASALLLAAGRTPNLDALDCAAAGVKTNKHGVTTNEYLQTSQPHIYAAGDVAGPYCFTHMADYQARIVVRNAVVPFQFLRQKVDYSVVPWCTYLEPEIARVGLNETEAKKQKIEFDLVRQEFAEIDRAVVESETAGWANILLKRDTDKILGVTIVAEHAGELIHEFVLAMKNDIGLGKISAAIHVYPTFSEVARKASDQQNKKRLTPFARKLFGWLYERQRS